MPVLLDFESRSRADLKKVGGRNYWEHPSTEAICAVMYDTESGTLDVWRPGDPDQAFIGAIAAHNAMGFDRFAAARVWGVPIDDPSWIDTSELARTAGLPGALDALGTRWLGIPKDKVASKFVKGLSRPSRAKARKGLLPDLTPEVMARVIAYCSSDVEIMAHGWPLLESWLEVEPEVSRVNRVINDRGIGFDVQLAKRLLECDARNAERACKEAAYVMGGRAHGWTAERVREVANSPQQFCEHTGADNAQAETIETIIATSDPTGEAHALATARQAIASIARGKLTAGIAMVSPDGRLRDMHRYYGAHTGRWSGRGIQLHNMPRPAKQFEDWGDADVCMLADLVLAGQHDADQEEIDMLLRACLVARPGHVLAVCDFSGVEARALAWMAGDDGALDVFADKARDPYKEMAAVIFGVPASEIGKDERRQIGKIAELACGYGMGAPKFDMTARKAGSDLEAMGVDPQAVVGAWRKMHAPIVRFWYALERAFADAVQGGSVTLGEGAELELVPSEDGRDVALFLPSGRPIVYSETRLSRDGKGRPQASYVGTKGREHTYGGKLAENAIQALCRDLLADTLVRTEAAGLCPVLHVHDEAVCEIPAQAEREGYSLLHSIMTDVPAWATGFPIGAAGHTGKRYRK